MSIKRGASSNRVAESSDSYTLVVALLAKGDPLDEDEEEELLALRLIDRRWTSVRGGEGVRGMTVMEGIMVGKVGVKGRPEEVEVEAVGIGGRGRDVGGGVRGELSWARRVLSASSASEGSSSRSPISA